MVNRKKRYAHLLWEFWKKDEELFPNEIIRDKKGLDKKPHAIIFVFDGSLDEVPDGFEEVTFYKRTLSQSKNKGYRQPFIILTKIDIFESKLRKKLGKDNLSEEQIKILITSEKAKLIENVSFKLKVNPKYISFIENYSYQSETKKFMVDYYAMNTLAKIIVQCEQYIKDHTKSNICKIF